jgi:hypothetical protein
MGCNCKPGGEGHVWGQRIKLPSEPGPREPGPGGQPPREPGKPPERESISLNGRKPER